MASSSVLVLLVFSLLRLPPMLDPKVDKATQEGMQQRADLLNMEMARQLEQLEQLEQARLEQESTEEKTSGQTDLLWSSLSLCAAFKQWQFWLAPGNLVLLVKLCAWLRRKISVESSKDGKERSGGSEEKENSMKEEEEEEEDEDEEEEEKENNEEDSDCEGHLYREPMRRSSGRVADMRWVVVKLVGELLCVLRGYLSDGFFPMPQTAIGVGSSFEGWGPCGHDANYCLLVPLKAPRGHVFKLELGSAQEVPAKHRVRVVQKKVRCFVHQPHEVQQKHQDSSLLSELCTGRYLDVEKTSCWFQSLVTSAWEKLPSSHGYALKVLPSSRSCKMELRDTCGRHLSVELLFGVQQGNSDVFVSSQAPEALFPSSTTWAESYAVAEAKFFQHLARQAPQDTFHLKCLEIYAGTPAGTVLSSSFLKTAVMHLLNFIPLSGWRRASYLTRL